MLTAPRRAGAGSAATEFGRTVMIGVPVLTAECTIVAPPNTDCSATIFPPSLAQAHGVAEHPGAGLDREPPGDLLVLPGGGQQHRRG